MKKTEYLPVRFTAAQFAAVQAAARERGCSRGAVVRLAVEALLMGHGRNAEEAQV